MDNGRKGLHQKQVPGRTPLAWRGVEDAVNQRPSSLSNRDVMVPRNLVAVAMLYHHHHTSLLWKPSQLAREREETHTQRDAPA
jgi:hypothetical protein